MLQRKVSLSVELSQLDYGNSGVVLRWNDVRLTVPYEQLQLESNPYLLLDELKAELRGVVTIILRCHLVTGIVERIEVEGGSSAMQELAQTKSRIELLVDDIRSATATGSLTIMEAKQILHNHEFDPPEDTTHTILSKIIDCMPLQTIKRSLVLPLSQLQYDQDGVTFCYGDTQLKAPKGVLKSEVRSIFETIKDHLKGNMIFELQTDCLLKWGRSTSRMLVGQVEDLSVIKAELDSEASKAFTRIERLVDDVRTATATGSLTITEAKQILHNHEFDPPDDTTHTILSKIIDCMPLQTIKKSLVLPLSQLRYDQDEVTFCYGDAQLKAPKGVLKFEVRSIFETIKDLLKGNMIFELQTDCLLKWRRSASRVLVGQVGDVKVITAELDTEASKALAGIERLVDDIRTATATASLTIAEAKQILHNHAIDPPDEDRTHTILSKIIDCMPPRTIKQGLVLPLSQLRYDQDGVTFCYGNARLKVPKGVLNFEVGSVFEAIKDLLKGNMIFELQTDRLLKWGRSAARMLVGQVGDVSVIAAGLDTEASKAFTGIERLVDDISAAAATGFFTITEAKEILHNHEFDPPEDTTHTILSKIIDSMPLQTIKQRLALPLSQLLYDQDGVTFCFGDTQLKAPKEHLKLDVCSIFETIKDRLKGNMIFELQTDCLLKWERTTSRMLVGQVEDVSVITAEIEPGASKAFTSLRCKIICESIEKSTDRSIEQIERLLTEWCLSSSDEDVGQQIASGIPAWVSENDYSVPLEQVTFYDSRIEVSLPDKTIRISSGGLPFKPLAVAEKIKDTFEGNIRIHLSESLKFVWEKSGFMVKRVGELFARTEVDKEALEILQKLCALYVSLLEKYESFKPDLANEVFRTSKKPESSVRSTYRVHNDYDRRCITILEGLATNVYIMTDDLWFHIGKYLVWEHPTSHQATYIFHWPQRDWELTHLIGRILASKHLKDLRDSKESGFVIRVLHEGGTVNWERMLRKRVR